ncbi:hypothetical protein DDE18_21780 [Nocardioides gansuensis]|uniref:Uncharacterized protein n=1 Tax=Nocardioides gansuensis TaxID=2138300 RepID=A0A2T8F4P9_9ACTN|nr:hypothetical protein [Nocardioides gansuensis]PVG80703.1 hypothetical protein DDE18_21780 [Nocardioides gansuensis]
MLRSRIHILALVGILVGALLGLPSAAAGQADDATTNLAARVVQGRQVFVLISTDPSDAGAGRIVAFGPIHAIGHDTVLGPRRDRFEFPDGNLIIRHRPVRTPVERFDPVTCYFKFVEVGRWRVTRGTGDYVDAAGRGRYRVVGEGIGRKDAQGQCSENRRPLEFYVKVRAVGRLRY